MSNTYWHKAKGKILVSKEIGSSKQINMSKTVSFEFLLFKWLILPSKHDEVMLHEYYLQSHHTN